MEHNSNASGRFCCGVIGAMDHVAYVGGVAPPKRDVVKARASLKAAGVVKPLPVPLIVYNRPQGVQAGEVIQSMTAQGGFAVQVNAMERATEQRGEYVMTLWRLVATAGPRPQRVELPAHSGALNHAGYS